MLINMGACPFCGGGNNTPCFATFDNGYHCFTCGKKKSTDRAQYAYRPMLKTINKDLTLPEHTQNTCEFSPSVLKWLYSYYVYDELIRKYGIAYVPYAKYGVFEGESLILPVIIDNQVVSFQQRFFPKKQFLTKGDKTSPFMIKCHNSVTLVLVEDYISAVRVGQHANVICLHGVHVLYDVSKLIQNLNMNIEIWLDPDEAGQTASKELLTKLAKDAHNCAKYRAFAVREPRTITIRSTKLQPKDYSDYEIQQILRGDECLKQY